MLAKKQQEELEARDKAMLEEYTESTYSLSMQLLHSQCIATEDLVGLKVSHDFEALNEGEDRILTLKDSRILDNEGT